MVNELPRAKAFRFGSNSLREERYLIALSSKTLRRKRLGIKPVQIKRPYVYWCMVALFLLVLKTNYVSQIPHIKEIHVLLFAISTLQSTKSHLFVAFS